MTPVNDRMTMPLDIREEDPAKEDIVALLTEHLAHMHAVTPPESVHAMEVGELRAPDITFWAAREGSQLVGVGALKEIDTKTGEIKSMRTVAAYRGKGIASKVLHHIVEESRRRGHERLNLETGSQPEFAAARALYEKHGFEYRGPFGPYAEDPNSVFMTKKL